MISAILLAAGRSTRLGRPKQLLSLGHTNIINACILNIRSAGINSITVVTGYEAEKIEAVLEDVSIARNSDYLQGMISSIKAGIAAQPASVEAALLALCDQPHVSATLISQLLDRYKLTKCSVVKPRYLGQSGHPIVLNRSVFPNILSLGTGERLDLLLKRYDVQYVDTDEVAVVEDIDTEEDYLSLLKRLKQQLPG
ncbi:MAG: nucleotidyltransferase family protein [Acidobacteriota bacterium]|nr:nucleotidyltransferase family protein [Blastocatellia bacterium]MDW8411991.1 nucleotidyltransferase family protein [Acidobacteriota bacterium]